MKKIFATMTLVIHISLHSFCNLDSMYFHVVKPKDDIILNKPCYLKIEQTNYVLFSSCKSKLTIYGNSGDTIDISLRGIGNFRIPFISGENFYFYIYQSGFFPFKRNHLLMVTHNCFYKEASKRKVHDTIQKKSKYNIDKAIMLEPIRL